MSKRYYWLKLQKDFFKRHDIQVIENMQNGKDYILFYMKLLVESISHEGELRFSDTIPYDEIMLSAITNTNVDIVRSAIKIFTELGLMDKWNNGTIFMNEMQKMVGTETEYAKKKRLYRANKETITLPEGQKKTMSDKSKEIRVKSKEIKETINSVAKDYTSNNLLIESIIEFTKHRTKLKKPMTPRALKGILTKLDNWYTKDEQKINALDESIINGWLSIYEPKGFNDIEEDSNDPFGGVFN